MTEIVKLLKNGNEINSNNIQVVENANGTALKFPNGIMICYKDVSFTNVNVTSAWGILYESGELNFGNWPVEFKATPVTSLDIKTSSGIIIESHFGVTVAKAGAFWACRPNSYTGISLTASVIGFGRWK